MLKEKIYPKVNYKIHLFFQFKGYIHKTEKYLGSITQGQ
jgi:hypothetical protein